METLRLLLTDIVRDLPTLERALLTRGLTLWDCTADLRSPSFDGAYGVSVALEVVVARGDEPSARVRVELGHAHGGLYRAVLRDGRWSKGPSAFDAIVTALSQSA